MVFLLSWSAIPVGQVIRTQLQKIRHHPHSGSNRQISGGIFWGSNSLLYCRSYIGEATHELMIACSCHLFLPYVAVIVSVDSPQLARQKGLWCNASPTMQLGVMGALNGAPLCQRFWMGQQEKNMHSFLAAKNACTGPSMHVWSVLTSYMCSFLVG